jgi:quercetin dioxygenase-like cupin family protein
LQWQPPKFGYHLNSTEFDATILMAVGIPANGLAARHTHPGVESTYIAEGGGELSVKGQPNRTLKSGDTFHIPPVVPHAWKNDAAPTKLIITYVVDKNKPLASPAPE